MDYILTFEDGSEGYLAHHGVLGMKWGVRNAETRARYASEGRGRSGGYSSASASGGHKGLTEGQKRALKTAAIGVGAAAAIGGGVYLARRGGLKKLNTARKLAVNAAKREHEEVAKSFRDIELADRKMATEQLLRKNADRGLTRRGARFAIESRIRQDSKKMGSMMVKNGSFTPNGSRRELERMSNYARDGHRAVANSRHLMNVTIERANTEYQLGKEKIDRLANIGMGGAIAVGTGAGYTYNRQSKKRSKSRVA